MGEKEVHGDAQREIDLLRHHLRECERALANSEREVTGLRAENTDLQAKTRNAQEQLRLLRSSPAWRVSSVIVGGQTVVVEAASQVTGQLRTIKRKVIG